MRKQKTLTPADEVKKTSLEVVSQMLVLTTSGLGLVAALAWNTLIQEIVDTYVKKFFPGNAGVISLGVYAIVITILAVVVTLQLTKLKERLELK